MIQYIPLDKRKYFFFLFFRHFKKSTYDCLWHNKACFANTVKRGWKKRAKNPDETHEFFIIRWVACWGFQKLIGLVIVQKRREI